MTTAVQITVITVRFLRRLCRERLILGFLVFPIFSDCNSPPTRTSGGEITLSTVSDYFPETVIPENAAYGRTLEPSATVSDEMP